MILHIGRNFRSWLIGKQFYSTHIWNQDNLTKYNITYVEIYTYAPTVDKMEEEIEAFYAQTRF